MAECIPVMADALAQFTKGDAVQPLRTMIPAKPPQYGAHMLS